MPVYEIKDNTPLAPESQEPRRKDLDPVDAVRQMERVGSFKQEWNRRKRRQGAKGRRVFLSSREERDVRLMVERLNNNLADNGILMHLSLVKHPDGFSLEIYDCSSGTQCAIVRDMNIDIEDLSVLLKNLHKESGLIIDTVS